MSTLRELLEEEEFELLLEAVDRYRKFCKGLADRPILGYGRVSEKTKKEEWKDREEELEHLQSKLAEEWL